MRFVNAINALNPQFWAFMILITGVFAVWLFHAWGIEIGIAAGIIGVAGNMFNSFLKPAPPAGTSTSHLEVDSTPAAIPQQPVGLAQPKV